MIVRQRILNVLGISHIHLKIHGHQSFLCSNIQPKNAKLISTSSWRFGPTELKYDVSRFNDIHIRADHIKKYNEDINANITQFESTLQDSINKWKSEKRSSVWFYLPIELADYAKVLGKHGFTFHNAENNLCVLNLWLPKDRKSKIPIFATHQMGVAGVVYRPSSDNKSKLGQILAIKDRHMVKDSWKLPGGAADLGENLQDTAVREVFEETGIQSRFCSVIGFRQQHQYPGVQGNRSDLYVICRLEPLSFDIHADTEEIKACEWINLDFFLDYKNNLLTRRIAAVMKHGIEHGFDSIDICPNHMQSPFAGRTYNFFHRKIDETPE